MKTSEDFILPAFLRSTKTVDDYKYLDKTGPGYTGIIKKVNEKTTGEIYALHTIPKRRVTVWDTKENLKEQIKNQIRLKHPNIVKLYHCFEDKENVYLVTEFVENGPLLWLLGKRGKLSEKEAFLYFLQACLAMDYLHKRKIYHRIFKPENLLLTKENNLKLCDLGLEDYSARAVDDIHDYMSPEKQKNEHEGETADLWCLGILLYELLHGFERGRATTNGKICKNITQNIPIKFSSDVSKEAKDLIQKILKLNPKDRLSLREIVRHKWMKMFEMEYGLDIQSLMGPDELVKEEQGDRDSIRGSVKGRIVGIGKKHESNAESPRKGDIKTAEKVEEVRESDKGNEEKEEARNGEMNEVKIVGEGEENKREIVRIEKQESNTESPRKEEIEAVEKEEEVRGSDKGNDKEEERNGEMKEAKIVGGEVEENKREVVGIEKEESNTESPRKEEIEAVEKVEEVKESDEEKEARNGEMKEAKIVGGEAEENKREVVGIEKEESNTESPRKEEIEAVEKVEEVRKSDKENEKMKEIKIVERGVEEKREEVQSSKEGKERIDFGRIEKIKGKEGESEQNEPNFIERLLMSIGCIERKKDI